VALDCPKSTIDRPKLTIDRHSSTYCNSTEHLSLIFSQNISSPISPGRWIQSKLSNLGRPIHYISRGASPFQSHLSLLLSSFLFVFISFSVARYLSWFCSISSRNSLCFSANYGCFKQKQRRALNSLSPSLFSLFSFGLVEVLPLLFSASQ
jgi:hypothetical protein